MLIHILVFFTKEVSQKDSLAWSIRKLICFFWLVQGSDENTYSRTFCSKNNEEFTIFRATGHGTWDVVNSELFKFIDFYKKKKKKPRTIFNKNIVSLGQVEYSYFTADVRL